MLSGAATGHITGWSMPLSPVHRCGKRRVWLAELLEEFAAMWTERVFFHFSAAPCALLLGYLGHSSTRNSLRNWCHGFFHRSCHCESTRQNDLYDLCAGFSRQLDIAIALPMETEQRVETWRGNTL